MTRRKELIQKEALPRLINESDTGVFALLGAGDIGLETKKIINHSHTIS